MGYILLGGRVRFCKFFWIKELSFHPLFFVLDPYQVEVGSWWFSGPCSFWCLPMVPGLRVEMGTMGERNTYVRGLNWAKYSWVGE